MRVFLFTNSFFVAGFQMLFLSSKCNRWVRVEVRTLLHDADNKRKKGRVQNENRANWNDESNGLRVANIWIVCVFVYMRKLKLDNILATLHLLCAKFRVDSLRLVADVSSLAGSQSINPSHM